MSFKTIEVDLPLPTIKEKGKFKNLSLNVYRNAYFRNLNNSKREYADIVRLKLHPHRKKKFKKARITYTLFNKTKHRRDLSNFCVAVDKFFCDVLTSMKIIKDDDCFTVSEVTYRFGGVGEDKIKVLVEEVV